jgi:hypothetical protein
MRSNEECRGCKYAAICLPLGREALGFELGRKNHKDDTPCGTITEFIENIKERMRAFEEGVLKARVRRVQVDSRVPAPWTVHHAGDTSDDEES